MHRYRSLLLAGALAGCTIGGDDASTHQLGEIHSSVAPGATLYGMHDPGAESLMAQSNGWVVYNDYLDQGPLAINTSLGALVRINATGGSLPCFSDYDIRGKPPTAPELATPYGIKVASFARLAANASVHNWIIGNETNLGGEWPTCNGQPEAITPEHYVEAFDVARVAIHSVPGHASDHVLVAGVGMWAPGYLQYYESIMDGLPVGGVDGIAMHIYTKGSALSQIDTDVHGTGTNSNLLWGFHAYRDYLNVTPFWARDLPVYITETDQDDTSWDDTNNGWVKHVYADINSWNQGDHQKIQAVALYRWRSNVNPPAHFELFQYKDVGGVRDDFRDATRMNYPSPAPQRPSESHTNECSLEAPYGSQPSNGFTISGWINHYWNLRGLGVYGLALTNAHKQINSSGDLVCEQLFERARIELQLNAEPNATVKLNPDGTAVMTLGRLGAERVTRDQLMIDNNPRDYSQSGGSNPLGDCEQPGPFPTTKTCGAIRDYWNAHGRQDVFGWPITGVFQYSNGQGSFVAQYFERARIELHPDLAPPYNVLGGLVGAELYDGTRH